MKVDHLINQIKQEADNLRIGDPQLSDDEAWLTLPVAMKKSDP